MYACRTTGTRNPVQGLAAMANKSKTAQYPGLVRRLMAVFYDALLLLSLMFIATALLMTLNEGKAIQAGEPLSYVLTLALLTIGFLFYGWFWTHGGQTLGMKTWKMKLIRQSGKTVTWPIALVRFVTAMLSWAVFGQGFLWSLFDSRNRTWHDIASGCELRDLRFDRGKDD